MNSYEEQILGKFNPLKTQKLYLIYRDDKLLGYTVTPYEADDLCKRVPDLQWEQGMVPENIPQLTIHDYDKL